jgi:hypothetical protein
MAQPGPKALTRTRQPLSKEFRANIGKRRPTDPATGRYVAGGKKYLLPVEAIAIETADKAVTNANRLKELAPDTIEFLARVMNTSHYRPDTRVSAARILLEHALGKPKQAVVPTRERGGEMTWEALLEKIRAAADAGKPENPPAR